MYTFKKIDIKKYKINDNNTKKEECVNTYLRYNFNTRETLRMKRLSRRDIFNDELIQPEERFEYFDIWDAYTGKKTGKHDEFGPLCFNGFELCYFYYINRLNGIWNKPEGEYDGYYGELLGSGININIVSRGCYPERYLLRLPVIDCYVPEDAKHSHITMGPMLTNDEINKLDDILDYNYKNFNKIICNSARPMAKIKFHYDEALNSNPDEFDLIYSDFVDEYPELEKKDIIEKYNRYHVDILRNM